MTVMSDRYSNKGGGGSHRFHPRVRRPRRNVPIHQELLRTDHLPTQLEKIPLSLQLAEPNTL
jgi:hypothetical protein